MTRMEAGSIRVISGRWLERPAHAQSGNAWIDCLKDAAERWAGGVAAGLVVDAENSRCIEDVEQVDNSLDLAEVLSEPEALGAAQIEELDGWIEERADRFDGQGQCSLVKPRQVHGAPVRLALRDAQGRRTRDSPRKLVASQRFVLPMPIVQAAVVKQEIGILRAARGVGLDVMAVGGGETPCLVLIDVEAGHRLPLARKAFHDLKVEGRIARTV